MKEKYRNDMKKELKKLQRLRDIFRKEVENTVVKDQWDKMIDARACIEEVSYQFGPLALLFI